MPKNKTSELKFSEVFFAFDFHFNNKRERYSTKLDINKRIAQEMIDNGTLYYVPCNEDCGEIFWNWNFWDEEYLKYKKKYNRIYKYIKELSDNFNLIYDGSKSVLLVFDPDRKYKNITYIYQE